MAANPNATSGGVSIDVTAGSYIARTRSIETSHDLDALMADVYLLNPSVTLTLTGLEPNTPYPITVYGHDGDSYDGAVTTWSQDGATIAITTNRVADYEFYPSYATGYIWTDGSGAADVVGTRTVGSYGMLNGLVVHDAVPPSSGAVFIVR